MNSVVFNDTSISSDYQRILGNYPVLDSQTEYTHAVSLYEHGDLNAAQVLVLSNLRGVLYVARQYNGYGLSFQDLVQEGMVGLMRAVRRYNPYKKVRVFIYALPWIKAEIQSYIVKNWKIVKIATTDARKKLFFGLRSLKNKLLPLNQDDVMSISDALEVSKDDLLAVDTYFSSSDLDIDSEDFSVILKTEQDQPDIEILNNEYQNHISKDVPSALLSLDSRSQDIITARYLNDPPATLSELSLKWNISIERVRQLESKALTKLKNLLPYFNN